MRTNHFIILGILLLVSACASNKTRYVQEQPPGFLGKIMQNTTARYNAYYNANKIYSESLISGEDSYQEDYTEEMPVSVQDAVSKSGTMAGEMDEVIRKTSRIIEKKPYSKWVDDNYLLNGIAHYVKEDYEMALDIFTYVASEYKNGVIIERVGARQRVKAVNIDKLKKEQAKEKLAERERKQKELEREREKKIKQREEKAKESKKRKKVLTKDEQYELKQQAKKEGKDLTTKELLEQIRQDQQDADEEGKEVSEADRELIASAPAKKNENEDNPGFLAHPLAAKDAMLWLAKTYITTEKFIAANAVLTAINEDPSFPNRLNKDYYLTYADMHIRLQNLPKAIEYVQLAIDDSKRKDKGRLYYVLGQIYLENDQPELAREAFNTVEKYHPEYNMIYHAQMRNIRKDYEEGKFSETDFTKQLEAMKRDAKNEEFFGEVFYYLGNAYKEQGEGEKAVSAYNESLNAPETKPYSHALSHYSLANHYYQEQNYSLAQENFETASAKFSSDSMKKQKSRLYADALETIVASYKSIQLQDSLLELSRMPEAELTAFLENKIKDELKEQLREKLAIKNDEFGSGSSSTNNNRRNRRRNSRNISESDSFYFYDVQQTSQGFSDFKRIWGNRPNTDNWRRSSARRVNSAINRRAEIQTNKALESGSPDAMLNKYMGEIPFTDKEKQIAVLTIQNEYLKIGEVFVKQLGEYEKAELVLNELLTERNPTTGQKNVANELLAYSNAVNEPVQSSSVNESVSEIERLYTETYKAYEKGKYELVVDLFQQAKSYQNNSFADKFAFIHALSKGELEGGRRGHVYLREFIQDYPSSPLVEKANTLLD